MRLIDPILGELDHESKNTHRLLERVPAEHLSWAPHAKSMSLVKLAWHIAAIPARVEDMLRENEFDMTSARPMEPPDQVPAIVSAFERNIASVRARLDQLDDDAARRRFTLRRGENVVAEIPTISIIRNILLNHTYHHRGQLTVYLRLLEVPVPAMYGTTADENPFA